MTNERPICLTIGTSDSSGAAGIQADLKTFTALGCYGASVLTAATAQNLSGIRAMHILPDAFVRKQLSAVTDELPVVAVKLGLCPSVSTLRMLGRWLREQPGLPLVVDPVIVDGRGIPLLQPEAIEALKRELLPRATVITPNRFQAAILTGVEECVGQDAMETAAKALFKQFGCPTVVSGGGLAGECRDVFVGMDGVRHFDATGNGAKKLTGRGSTFSAAITAGLARGDNVREAILSARLYVGAAMDAAVPIGGTAPLWHGATTIPAR
jgi:hydroxymethylpyrimidine/phosphomethylpyrimidine kinase